MGNFLSTASGASKLSTPPEATATTAFLSGGGDKASSSTTSAGALFLSEVKAEPATWSQEGICFTIQRLFGLLPDSAAEALKKEQRQPMFQRRPSTFGLDIHMRADVIVAAQRVYRRYRVLSRWHEVAGQVLELARSRLETRRAVEEEQITLANFRALLSAGFSAHKVSITGALKAIQLQLVMDARAEECYLTWSPSRKRMPRIHLHDVEQVVPVLRTGNKHAPRLASKVSHRRGLIIVCKSHHRGRVVLEMAAKRERNLLLCGFERLLDEMNRLEPTLDDAGAIRKRLPRRQSVIEFFEPETRPPALTTADSEDVGDEPPSRRGSTTAKRDSAAIEQLYATRFDSPLPAPVPNLRRSSVVLAVPARS
ncbi:hypothetical protein PybrP1_005766 [[Pythium] brassicae (nom. inval.)]|nr:hypothetical protein PybrP1_005766 [[Pythium] brassicae (nom. inval.)]